MSILKDPVKRAQYDQGREAKRRNDEANQKMKAERKKGKEELEAREREASTHVNGVKSVKAHSILPKEAIEKRRREEQTRRREAAKAQMQKSTASEVDEDHRLVKVTWAREGKGLDIDKTALKEMCEAFGPVENVRVIKDKRRHIDGQKKKSIFGAGLIVFASLAAAQEAVKKA